MTKSIIYKAKEDKDIQEDLRKLQALQKEPCEDAVSRKAVLDIIEKEEFKGDALSEIEKLPSVNPQKIGHWTHDESHWKNRFICSECEYKLFDEQTNYCPNCGSKMVEPQESEDKE